MASIGCIVIKGVALPHHELAPGFMVIHGNQPELLRQLLVHWFRAHPLDPLEDEDILVQSNGIAQWLKLALAADHRDGGGCGIAAAVNMLLPSRFVWQVYRAVLGREAVPETSPFDKPLLLWRLMRLLPALVEKEGYAPLRRFLENDADLRKRYQLSEKIADMFDQYQVYRADWLDAWASGNRVLPDIHGNPRPLEEEQQWQALLWRALLDDVGATNDTSRAAIHQRFLKAASQLQERPAGLPRRVSVFGLSSLPRQSLEVLLAISRFTQVLLCVNNPCEHYWANLLSEKDMARRSSGRHARKQGAPDIIREEELHLHAHPLLAAWGKQAREYIALLDELDDPDAYRGRFAQLGERVDIFESHGQATMLNQLQDDIRVLRSARETQATWPAIDPAQDQSIRFHVTHSVQREVEVLHDQVLAALNADATLRPRDIIVMVPDVNKYAPHIEAVFGQMPTTDPRHIPFSITDQQRRHQAPIVFAVECLLGIQESRLSVSNLMDLLDVPALRQRFGMTEDDLPLLRQWTAQTQIRWGLDAKHRSHFMPDGYEQNTWMHGMKRMLLGYAVGGDPAAHTESHWHDIEPYAEVAGLEAALAGPLSRLLTSLSDLLVTFREPATPDVWQARLHAMLQAFFLCETPEDAALMMQLSDSLQYWRDACDAAALTEAMPLSVMREHWLVQIDQSNLAQRFMAGRLTFATLMPMRAIPFRMVCLLGMNDGEFPRVRPPLDFDLMAREIRPGDRSRRDDDRFLFLEALLSAREKLHVSWVGRSINDNSERPASVLVGQLRDHLAACWSLADGTDLLQALTVEHRLQAFSPAYFRGDAQSPLFTYAREWENNTTTPSPATLTSGLPLATPEITAPIQLSSLASFLKEPVRTFYRERLRINFDIEDLSSEDQEPFALDGLSQWKMQDELIGARLDAILHGRDEEEAVRRQSDRIRRRGELPLGQLAPVIEASLAEPLEQMFDLYRDSRAAWPGHVEDRPWQYSCTIDDQTIVIEDRITDCYRNDEDKHCRIVLNSSNLIDHKKYRCDKLLGEWVRHLAANLDQATTTHVIGKNGRVVIHALAPGQAETCLDEIIGSWLQALCMPLPLAAKTGFTWLAKGGHAFPDKLPDNLFAAYDAARDQYQGGAFATGEVEQSAYLQHSYPAFDTLWSDGMFARLCDALYAPLSMQVGKQEEAQ